MDSRLIKERDCFIILDAALVDGDKKLSPLFLNELTRIKEKSNAYLYAYSNKNDPDSLNKSQKNFDAQGLKIDRIVFDSNEDTVSGCLDEMKRITSQSTGFLFFTRSEIKHSFTPGGVIADLSVYTDIDEADEMVAKIKMTEALDHLLPPSGFSHYDKCRLIDNKPFFEVEIRIATPEALQNKKKAELDCFDDYNYFKARLRFDIDYNLYELKIIRVEFESCRMIDWSYTEGEEVFTGELVTGHTMLTDNELQEIIELSKPATQYQIDLFC